MIIRNRKFPHRLQIIRIFCLCQPLSLLLHSQHTWRRQLCSQVINRTAAVQPEESLNTGKPPSAPPLQPKHRMWSFFFFFFTSSSFSLIPPTSFILNMINQHPSRHYLYVLSHPVALSRNNGDLSNRLSSQPPRWRAG